MKLKDLIEQHTLKVVFCGHCECGERKYDLITDQNCWRWNDDQKSRLHDLLSS